MPVWNFSFSFQMGRRQQNRPNQTQANGLPGVTEAAVQNATMNIEGFQQLRNRLFHHIFQNFSLTYARFIPREARRVIEFLFLLKAVVALALLVYIHIAFSKMPCTCLSRYYNKWPKDGILRVDIHFRKDKEYSLEESYLKESVYAAIEAGNFDEIEFDEADFNSVVDNRVCKKDLVFHQTKFENVTSSYYEDVVTRTCFYAEVEEDAKTSRPKASSPRSWPMTFHILEFSLEYGLLRLSPQTRKRLKVPVMLVTIDPADECFGNIFSFILLNQFLGYDHVLMGALRDIAEKEEGNGYLRNALTGDHFKFVNLRMSPASYLSSFFVMIVFTLSVSLLLKYSHHQIFVFIVNLLHLLEFNTASMFSAGPLLAIILALIGIEAIMSSFFNDTTTAFYIILILWVAEHYDAICSQSNIIKRHWLRFFFLYHYAFYAYHYRFNGQNSTLALFTSWFFIQHSMMYFFHHYELPLILRQNNIQEAVRRQVERFEIVQVPVMNNGRIEYEPTVLRVISDRPPSPPAQDAPLAPDPIVPSQIEQDY